MKLLIVIAGLVAVTLSAPQRHQDDVVVIKQTEHDNIGVGAYRHNFELSNGHQFEETGELRNVPGSDTPVIVVTGRYSYVDPETNQVYTVDYVADDTGFHPSGAHLPV